MNYSKDELRNQIREEIASLPDGYIADSDRGLFLQVTSLEEFIYSRNIFIYHSFGREPDTLEIILAALSVGKTVTIPYCIRKGVMQARVIYDLDDLRPGSLGIPMPLDTSWTIAPGKLDLVIVPALTYDVAGYRLGHGGGHYDRYLADVTAYTIGLARDRLIKEKLPRESHDIAVKCVMTENGIRNSG